MEAHSSLPDRQHFGGVREIVERLVEQHIAESAAENRSENAVEKHVVDVARMPTRQKVLTRANLAEDHELYEADQVHQPIPTHRKRAQLKGDRIELRMNEHWKRGAASFGKVYRCPLC